MNDYASTCSSIFLYFFKYSVTALYLLTSPHQKFIWTFSYLEIHKIRAFFLFYFHFNKSVSAIKVFLEHPNKASREISLPPFFFFFGRKIGTSFNFPTSTNIFLNLLQMEWQQTCRCLSNKTVYFLPLNCFSHEIYHWNAKKIIARRCE